MALKRSNNVRPALRRVPRTESTPAPARPVLLGQVVSVGPGRAARVMFENGTHQEARCARPIDCAWLTAALEQVGPVPVGLIEARDGWWITAILDGPEFDSVLADVELTGRTISLTATSEVRVEAERVQVSSQRSRVLVTEETIEVRADDVTTRARKTNRVKGGVVRIN
jgi:hypothetical protein